MSDKEQLITCGVHGKQPITYVCQHIVQSLKNGKGVGFNIADDSASPRPDAWCDECEEVLIANGGEWNDISEQYAGVTIVCAGCYDKAKRLNLSGFTCVICGKIHDELPMDVAYKRPADYFRVPENERDHRIKLDDDICIIDGNECYIRGILALPIIETDKEFRWGIWSSISQKDLHWYLQHWNDEKYEDGLAFSGVLSGGIKFYENSDLLEVSIRPQSGNLFPRFEVINIEHPLALAQRNGVTMSQVHDFVAPFLK